jgi:hypothetical protein
MPCDDSLNGRTFPLVPIVLDPRMPRQLGGKCFVCVDVLGHLRHLCGRKVMRGTHWKDGKEREWWNVQMCGV